MLLVGDSIAETLGEGLGEVSVQDKYDYVLYDHAILGCGVADGTEVEVMGAVDTIVPACGGPPAPNDDLSLIIPWATQWAQEIAEIHPNVVVEGAGRWELVDRLYQGKWTNITQPDLAAYIKSQLEKAAAVANDAGLPMVFLTAPCTQEPEQPDGDAWPEDNPARRNAYNRMIREIAQAHPRTVSVDDLEKAACPGGRYASTVHGVVIRTANDGVHFTPQGGVFLAPALIPPIVAAGRAQMAGGTAPASAGG